MYDNRKIDQGLEKKKINVEGQGGSILQVLTDHSRLQSSGSHLVVPEAHGVDGNKVSGLNIPKFSLMEETC